MAKYIKLSSVQKILESNRINLIDSKWQMTLSISPNCIQQINSLPSIDPQEMIREMIGNCWNLSDSFNEKMVWTTREKLLKELINKLP